MVRVTSHRWSPAIRRAFPLVLLMAGAAVAAGWKAAEVPSGVTRAAAVVDSEQGTPDPWGCITRTPTRTPTATPTSYRVYDASAQIAVSAPRVAPGETFQVMARGASPFGYRLSSSQLDGIRLTGVFTYTRSGQAQPDACTVTPAGFTCRDDHLIGHGSVTIYLDAIAGRPAERRTVCTRIDSPPPYGTGHDSNPDNNSDCVSFTVVPAATAPTATAAPTTARLPAARRMPPVDQPGTATTEPTEPTATRTATTEPTATRTATTEPTATRTGTPVPTGTGSPIRTVTSTPTPTIGLCDPPTATFTPTPTPTSVRMFDASVEAWSHAPRIPAGRAVRFVVHGDLNMKWRIDGTIEGSEGLQLTGAYTFTQLTSHPARRCVVEPRGFWCALDTPDDVYASTDEELFLDGLIDPGTAPGSASLCVKVDITAPRGSGGDPNGANNRACVGIAIVPAAADTPTPTAVVRPSDTPTPIDTPTPSDTPDGSPTPERARLWLPIARDGGD